MSRPRRLWFLFCTVLLAAAIGGVAPALAPPGEEEEEPAPKKPARKVVIEDDPPPGAVQPNALPDLVRAAAAATHPSLKTFLTTYSVPFDRITDTTGASIRVTPLPLLFGKDAFPKQYGVFVLDAQNQAGEVTTIALASTRRVDAYEIMAMADVDALLNPPKTTPADRLPPLADRYAAADRLLTQVLLFHDSAVEGRKRQGKSWEPVRTNIDTRLAALRVAWVKALAREKNWPQVRELTSRFVVRYKANPAILEDLYAERLAEADALLESDKLADLERVRDLLLDYESRFLGRGLDACKRIRTGLSKRARQFLAEADRLSSTNQTAARNIIRSVELFDPDQPGLQELRKQLKPNHAVLVVAAHRQPEKMSPATARYDSERQIVELLFEGLLDTAPDEKLGTTFHPALLTEKPRVSSLSRVVTLTHGAAWTNPAAGTFDASDLLGTVKLLREKKHLPCARGIDWLDEPRLEPSDPDQLRLRFLAGHPDPRLLLAGKMLPARWLEAQKKAIDDDGFAMRPFGTGPYQLAPHYRPADPGAAPMDISLVVNPAYSRRVQLTARPAIQEIRFVPMASLPDPLGEIRSDRLHILTDIPTADLDRYAGQTQAAIVTAAANRRIHLLAINHRMPSLRNLDIRKALMHGIDREAILNEVFRAGRKQYHRSLTGPFPADSWLVPAGASPLLAREAALKLGTPIAPPSINLLYPNDEPLTKLACEKIKAQLEEAAKSTSKVFTINLDAASPADFYRRVYVEHRYELAYLTHDYSSDWTSHELASWLDPGAAGDGGRNCFGYRVKSTLPTAEDDRFGRLLADIHTCRDPERLRTLSGETHRRFNEMVPFVPLWQIDRHMAVSSKLKILTPDSPEPVSPKFLDPTRLFQGVSRWRLE